MTEPGLYRGMDAGELDRQYDARGTVDDIAPHIDRYKRLSAEARRDLEVICDLSFGSKPEETFDFFPAGKDAPVFVFIHGGYWRLLSKDESSFFAKCCVAQGIAVAAVNYTLAPFASLDEIVRQVRAAITHIWHSAAEYGIDRERIFIGGSSAGGHLAGMLLSDKWQKACAVPQDVIAGAMSASGLFDLEPLRHCHPNEWIKLDAVSARRNSPIHHLPQTGCPLIVTWGGSETAEFKRQSNAYFTAWRQGGRPAIEFEVSDRNHFDIILDLADPDRDLARKLIAMIKTGGL